jgi:hypothetical protein
VSVCERMEFEICSEFVLIAATGNLDSPFFRSFITLLTAILARAAGLKSSEKFW